MRVVSLSHAGLLANIIIVGLLTSIFATAFNIDFSPRSFSLRFFSRSLPGSLATAPEGAVGYYQPPLGPPTVDDPLPPETWGLPTTTASSTTDDEFAHHELRHEPTSFANSTAHKLKNVMTVTKTQTQTIVRATSTAMASKDVILSAGSFSLSILLSLFRL